jgi:hypothetical protein
MSKIFKVFADDNFRFGNCFVRTYDHKDVATFGPNFLYEELYTACLAAAPSRPFGVLPEAFCGMQDLSADAICSYLHTRQPLLLMCTDTPTTPVDGSFDVIGFSFPTIWAGPPLGSLDPDPGRSMFKGYVQFRSAYRTPESVVCMMLSGIYFFHTYNLLTIQGQSYPHNHLTRKFLAQFGTKTIGNIPKFILHDGPQGKVMVDSVQSCLYREDFEEYCRGVLIDCAK